MRKMKKIIVMVILTMAIGIIVMPNKVSAVLQSNGGTPAGKQTGDWMLSIRKMQSAGGTLGLTDEINTTNLTSENKNLDIHMEKNTEYGAMVILSASSYGNPNKINDGETTTGNKTGVVMKLNTERVAAGPSNAGEYMQKGAYTRYKDIYPSSYVAKIGDAIAETAGWHGSGSSDWINSSSRSVLVRSLKGSIFSYSGKGQADTLSYPADPRWSWATRAVVVVGSGV